MVCNQLKPAHVDKPALRSSGSWTRMVKDIETNRGPVNEHFHRRRCFYIPVHLVLSYALQADCSVVSTQKTPLFKDSIGRNTDGASRRSVNVYECASVSTIKWFPQPGTPYWSWKLVMAHNSRMCSRSECHSDTRNQLWSKLIGWGCYLLVIVLVDLGKGRWLKQGAY